LGRIRDLERNRFSGRNIIVWKEVTPPPTFLQAERRRKAKIV
jgi:hypothetical protein